MVHEKVGYSKERLDKDHNCTLPSATGQLITLLHKDVFHPSPSLLQLLRDFND
jgi:hypothetical protein